MRAECQCGRLTADLPGGTTAVVACHCRCCQRRSGSPFGVLAYYPADQVTIGDPGFQPPVRSVWEESMHRWVALPDGVQRFPRGWPS